MPPKWHGVPDVTGKCTLLPEENVLGKLGKPGKQFPKHLYIAILVELCLPVSTCWKMTSFEAESKSCCHARTKKTLQNTLHYLWAINSISSKYLGPHLQSMICWSPRTALWVPRAEPGLFKQRKYLKWTASFNSTFVPWKLTPLWTLNFFDKISYYVIRYHFNLQHNDLFAGVDSWFWDIWGSSSSPSTHFNFNRAPLALLVLQQISGGSAVWTIFPIEQNLLFTQCLWLFDGFLMGFWWFFAFRYTQF